MSMSETETSTETPAEIDPIKPIYEGECPSMSGRSVLTFVVGRHEQDGSLHIRIAGNSGKGMWFDGWASAEAIDAIVKGATELTAKSFHALHPGKSINTGGFVLAALKHLGLVRVNGENSRQHECVVPRTTFEQVAMAVIDPAATTKKTKPVKADAKKKGS